MSRSTVSIASFGVAALIGLAAALPTRANGVTGASIEIRSSDAYGRVDIGRHPGVEVVIGGPVIIATPPRWVRADPVYRWVQPDHHHHWHRHPGSDRRWGRPGGRWDDDRHDRHDRDGRWHDHRDGRWEAHPDRPRFDRPDERFGGGADGRFDPHPRGRGYGHGGRHGHDRDGR